MTILVGLDIGLAHCGLACLDVTPDYAEGHTFSLIHAAVIVTEKRAGKVAVSTTEDNIRRMREFSVELRKFLIVSRPTLIVTESQSWPRSSSVVAKIGMAWGTVVGVLSSQPHPPPMFDVPPQAIKLAVCGKKTASKDEVIAAVAEILWADGSPVVWNGIKRADIEHAADAAAAVIAAVKYREDVKLWISHRQ